MVLSTFDIKRDMLNRNDMHKEVMKLFAENRDAENVLYMVLGNRIIIQSDKNPDISKQTCFSVNQLKNLDGVYSGLKNGDVVRILSVLEPTRKIKRQGKYSTNVGITNMDARYAWVGRKMEESGAKAIRISEEDKKLVYMNKNSVNKKRISLFTYQMIVEITNIDRFLESLRKGIGRSKAYGAGLSIITGYWREIPRF